MFKHLVLVAGLMLPAFAGRVVFTVGPSNALSSLTLDGAVGSAALGTAGVINVLNEDTSLVLALTSGSFVFTTGTRPTTPGTGEQALNAGGTWSISGTITQGLNTATGVLISGTFLAPTNIINQSGRNTLNGALQVNFVNSNVLTLLGIAGVSSTDNTVSFSRPGAFDTGTGAYTNVSSALSTVGSITFLADVPEPTAASLIGLGTLALVTRRLVRSKSEHGEK